ncbi:MULTISPECIES: heavy-metal-associated domain-containing protein [unclassified Campylobacter]|uniref:heavy-metal-associated domain-containing protein n=1 Tax=unclassified Campylobacter TaxID=2593542 RepID=UPI003FA411E5
MSFKQTMKFSAPKIMCNGCANTIKNALAEEFGEISVDVENKVVSVNLSVDEVEKFLSEMDDLGFSATKI